ncbi:hypothetical protein C1701_10565 [Actinoalloteichus sp. AHMU CJ021]|uniref:Uncharacterized protein n=1 Tax=Actinoalloteichus caeruleus DSM 43889 TaxID=1120930 RepID=A0ABT1JME8_ACTCY|nr:hypothetical protein [Actinoalloteichus caeruleus]AUS78736.1 hypothetical protein C1701_10565 [Actinoalloteichus sp. AHMU CJ021]MCP2332891.1 hypothetical protein [Actinoalloteichus caeruleus DSM 43889]
MIHYQAPEHVLVPRRLTGPPPAAAPDGPAPVPRRAADLEYERAGRLTEGESVWPGVFRRQLHRVDGPQNRVRMGDAYLVLSACGALALPSVGGQPAGYALCSRCFPR